MKNEKYELHYTREKMQIEILTCIFHFSLFIFNLNQCTTK